MDILTRLQQEKEALSQSERRIADILFSDFDFAVNASIIELAERADVSPPTVTRFCRRLECQSFSEFKVRLAQTAFVGTRYLNPTSRATSPAEIAENVITKAQSALYALHRSIDLEKVEAAAARIAEGRMIYAFGSGGNSSMVANEMQNRLFRLGINVTACNDHQMMLMMTAAATTQDVIVGSSFSGRNRELVRILEQAREYGIFTIALTQSDSPVSRAAGLALTIDLAEGVDIFRPTSTRIAYLAMTDVLANITAHKIKTQASATLRRIKQQLVTFRDEDDRQLLGD
ncbi:MurR/RpiR family transcriptional regulator [Rhizobium sp. NRK18]|uniref:MurR/RpiR family transcriptional regulator n=1 Tax=Rhizobium sp. NRK18 TaxID=2964667 RepID=UPI0021C2A32A|nr:MurR/RpiR family transcriptional regulator [Rhizobium sp. NRK18]MCQ2005732.1 MurR/RpiR family transcriptional regulator [Rhizobium sp. NRK18]